MFAGEGTHSYRLLEALQSDSVPVVVGGATVALPFVEVIDWSSIAVVEVRVWIFTLCVIPFVAGEDRL